MESFGTEQSMINVCPLNEERLAAKKCLSTFFFC
jgi:hypothetical protein